MPYDEHHEPEPRECAEAISSELDDVAVDLRSKDAVNALEEFFKQRVGRNCPHTVGAEDAAMAAIKNELGYVLDLFASLVEQAEVV